jgi:hypothetical protein
VKPATNSTDGRTVERVFCETKGVLIVVRKHLRILSLGTALLAGGAIGFGALAISNSIAGGSRGLAESMSALNGDAAPSPVDAGVLTAVDRAARGVGGDASAARASLRLLAANIGSAREGLYAFSPGEGSLCFIFWQRAASCQAEGRPGALPGVLFHLSPGGPGYPGEPDDLHAALAGVASDEVVSVGITLDGSLRSAQITNNAFFVDLGQLADWPSSTIELTATYVDGSEESVTLPNLSS